MTYKREQGRKLTTEEKVTLTRQIAELRATGHSLTAIASSLDTTYPTVKKLWHSYLGTLEDIDKPKTLRERALQAETALLKALKLYHAGKSTMRDLAAAFETADKYSGLDSYLKTLEPSIALPPILEMEITNVEIEMPDDDD